MANTAMGRNTIYIKSGCSGYTGANESIIATVLLSDKLGVIND